MKKLSAHYVFDGQHLRRNAVLEIDDDGKIIGLSGERQNFTESENLAFYNGIILPGIINMHQHLELAWMKDRITKKTEMAGFLSAVAALRNNIPVADAVINEMKTLDAIMYNRGIQAVLDISNSSNSISVKKSSNIKYFTAVELYGLDNEQTQKIIEKGQDVLNQFIANNLEAVLSPHSFYLVSHELMKAILQKSRTLFRFH